MRTYKSVGLTLDRVVKDLDYEKLIFENLKRCYKFTGKEFKVIFWNENISEKNVKEFVKRNADLLFEFKSNITKKKNRSNFDSVWFVIEEEDCPVSHRYQWRGSILSGLVEFTNMIRILNRRDKKNESGYNR
tara:strand:+ start:222 stop:617 length:396 start_codon:yes stop_codon:yes gene_type:complete